MGDLSLVSLISLISLIVVADFFGLPLFLIPLFTLMFKLMRSPALFTRGFPTSIDNTLFVDLGLLTVIILRPALSVGPPLIKEVVSLSIEREVSGASPFGESFSSPSFSFFLFGLINFISSLISFICLYNRWVLTIGRRRCGREWDILISIISRWCRRCRITWTSPSGWRFETGDMDFGTFPT